MKNILLLICATGIVVESYAQAPTITSVSPNPGNTGTSVTIAGTNFNTTPANNVVFFGATKGTVTAATATSLSVTVPIGGTHAPVSVLNSATMLSGAGRYPFLPSWDNSGYVADAFVFGARTEFASGATTANIATGDIDGDGKADLVTVNHDGGTVCVYRNTSTTGVLNSSSLASKVDLAVSLPYSATIKDMDGDGKPELIVAGYGAISVFRNQSAAGSITSGSFAAKVDFGNGTGNYTNTVQVADIDGDGKPDIVETNFHDNTVGIFRNQTAGPGINTGSFATIVHFATGANPLGLCISDFDGDGKNDVAVGYEGTAHISVLRNVATPGTVNSASLSARQDFVTASQPVNLVAADIDGDGKTDIATCNWAAVTISVLRNTATAGTINSGSFASRVDFSTGASPRNIAVGDMNGDGKADLVVLNQGISTVSIFRNTATAGVINSSSLAARADVSSTGTAPYGVAAVDLDGDHKPDLAIANVSSGSLSIIRNTPSFAVPTVTSLSPNSANPGTSVTIAGTNFNSTPANNIVYFGATKATVNTASATSLGVTVPVGATYMPVTVNSAMSSLTGYSQYPFLPKYDNSGYIAGVFNFAPKVDFALSANGGDVTVADIDGDGKPDMIAANYTGGSISIFRNTSITGDISASSFATKVDFATTAGPCIISVADFDGDGKLDIAVASSVSNTASVFRNTSTPGSINSSSFASRVDYTTGTTPQGLAIGDIDGDGKPDIVVSNVNAATISIFRNTCVAGAISFTTRVDYPSSNGPEMLCVNDMDGDGKSDIVVANHTLHTVSVFRNTSSSGTISSASLASRVDYTAGTNPMGVKVADIDGDSKPDIIVSNITGNSISVLRNLSTVGAINSTSFASRVDFPVGAAPTGVGAGDIDGDGKVDIVVANQTSGTVSLFRNLSTIGTISTASLSSRLDIASGSATIFATVADIDGDGKPEVLTSNQSSNSVSIFRNSPLNNPPTITSLVPAIANPGTPITITGTNFNTTPANNIVYFGATRATVNTASATSLGVTLPTGATYAPVSLLNTAISAYGYSQYPFLPTFNNAGFNTEVINCNNKVDFSTGTNPYSVATGDLDGDGKPDMVVTDHNVNTISVYKNISATGTISASSFAARVTFPTSAQPAFVTIADLDLDGKPEVITANNTAGTVSVFPNITTTGIINSSSFAASIDFATGPNTLDVATADVDGDGKPDIVVSNHIVNTVSVLRNTSAGSITSTSFAPKVEFTTGTTAFAVALGDLDGDAKPDMAVVNSGSHTVSVYRNTAIPGVINSSSFATRVDFTTGTEPIGVAIGDIDGDGKADLSVANYAAHTVSVLRNIATSGIINSSSFAAKVDFATGSNPHRIALTDMNGDGKADITVPNFSSGTVSVLRNTATSGSINTTSFAAKTDFATGSSSRSLALCDLDGDYRTDIIVSNFASNTVSVLKNAPLVLPPSITNVSPNPSNPGTSITITGTNFNTTPANNIVYFGATKATVNTASATSLGVTLPTGATYAPVSLLNTAISISGYSQYPFLPKYDNSGYVANIANFNTTHNFETGILPAGIAAADMDGDGKADLIVANQAGNSVSLFRNTATSGAINSSSLAERYSYATGSSPFGVATADLDGDGKQDVIVTNQSSNTISAYRNTVSGAGAFGASSLAAKQDFAAGNNPRIVAIADLDGDGKPDVIAGNLGDGTVSVFRNTSTMGSISFATEYNFAAGGNTLGVAAVDVDGDGKKDIIALNHTGNKMAILRNQSTQGVINTSSFASYVEFATGTAPFTVAGADIDGDGKQDLLVSNVTSGSVSVFRNTASIGSITTASLAPKVDFAAGSNTEGIAIGDINGDGKPDFVVANFGPDNASVFLNTATPGSITASSFAPKTDFATGTDSYHITIADIDGDGKGDICATNNGGASLSVVRNNPMPGVPTVTSVSPNPAIPGTSVTITGTNFNTTPANNIVYFGATKATVNTASSTSLTATVPAGATYAPVSVNNTANSLSGFSQYPFLPTYDNSGYVAGGTNFSPKVDLPAWGAFKIVAGDFDGDSKPDIASIHYVTNTVWIHRNTGTTGALTFSAQFDFNLLSGGGTQDVAVGDIDGDGKLDIIATLWAANGIAVLRNTSVEGTINSSSFASPVYFGTSTNPLRIAIGDFDNDGKPDVAVTCKNANKVSVLRNTSAMGAISFAAKVDFSTGTEPNGIATADIDQDGKIDIAVTNASGSSGNSVSVLRNTSTAGSFSSSSFASKVDFNTTEQPLDVIFSDFNGDGKLDMAVTSYYAVSVFRNVAIVGGINLESFATRVDFSAIDGTGNLSGIAVGDIDGNNKPDLIVGRGGSASFSVLRNIISGTTIDNSSFAPYGNFGSFADDYRDVAVNDMNGDGKPDVLLNNFDHGTISVFLNNPLSPIIGTTTVCASATTTLSNATPGGTWSSSNTDVATVGSTGVVAGVAAGTAVITYSVAGGSATAVVTVNALPAPGSISGATSVYTGASIALSSTTTGGVWSSSSASVAAVSSTGVVTGVAGGTATISYTVGNGCGSAAATQNVLVLDFDTYCPANWHTVGNEGFSDGTAGYPDIVFDADNVPYIVYYDGNYGGRATLKKFYEGVWQTVGAAGFTEGEANDIRMAIDKNSHIYIVYRDGSVGHKISVKKFDGSGWSTLGSLGLSAGYGWFPSIVVDTASNPIIVYGDGALDNKAVVKQFAGGAWVDIDAGNSLGYSVRNQLAVGKNNSLYVSTKDVGGSTGRVKKFNGSSWPTLGGELPTNTTDKLSIAVDTSGLPYVSYIESTVAMKGVVKQYNGAAWTVIDTGKFQIASGSSLTNIVIDINKNNVIHVLYRDGNLGGKPVVRKFTGAGWATVGVAGFSSGAANSISMLSDRAGVIHVTYRDAYFGEKATAKKVSPSPVVGSITGPSTLCSGSTVALSDTTEGGIWASSNATVAVISSAGSVTGTGAGTTLISYTKSNSCGSTTVTKVVTVHITPSTGAITGASSLCAGATTTLSNAVTGGTWSSSNTSVATVSSTGLATGAIAGTTIISYSVSNSCGTISATKPLSVNPLPVAGTIGGSATLCVGGSTSLTNTVADGTWSSGATDVATISSTGIVSGISPGVSIVSYVVTNSCGTAYVTRLMVVNTLPDAGTITGAEAVCIGGNVTLGNETPGGVWSSGNETIATINSSGIVSGLTAGTATISYSVTDACGTTSATNIVTVNTVPDPGDIGGVSGLCTGTTATLTATMPDGTWVSSTVTVATISAEGVVSALTNGTTTITYSRSNTCGSAAVTRTITVLPYVDPINGMSASVCTGQTIILTNVVSGGVWSSSNTAVGTVSASGAVTGLLAGTTIISYQHTSTCGVATAQKTVTVSETPSFTPGTMPAVCAADSVALLSYTSLSGGSDYAIMWDSAATAAGFVSGPNIITTVPGVSAGNVAFDAYGNMYFNEGDVVRKLASSGVVTTVAGNGSVGCSGDGGPATAAEISVSSIAVDGSGNVYISQYGENVVRRVTPSGIITTIAGSSGTGGTYAGDGGPATAAGLYHPYGIAADASGNLYIAEAHNHVIRKVSPSGVISTVVGNHALAGSYSGDGGPATAAGLNLPQGIALDPFGNLYFADFYNSVIRKVTPTGIISTVAGGGSSYYNGDGAPATAAVLASIVSVAADAFGNVYIAEQANYVVRRVSSSGIISRVAGTGTGGHSGDGGPATAAQIVSGTVAVDASGNLYIAGGSTLRKVSSFASLPSSSIAVNIPAGIDTGTYHGSIMLHNGHCSSAYPVSVKVYGKIAGTRYICTGNSETFTNLTPGGTWSSSNSDVATVSSTGIVTGIAVGTATISYQLTIGGAAHYATMQITVTATPSFSFGVMPVVSTADTAALLPFTGGPGSTDYSLTWSSAATSAGFVNTPHIISTVAGNGTGSYSGDGGPATAAGLTWASGVAVSPSGNMYIASQGVVRRVLPSGIISTVAGTGVEGYSGDGGPATAAQITAYRVTVDEFENIYIAGPAVGGMFSGVVRKVSPTGIISTIAGNPATNDPASGNGWPATSIHLTPVDVALDASGNLYIADDINNLVRRVSPSGIISIVAGSYATGGTYSGDGGPATAAGLYHVEGVAVDAIGNIYIAELGNNVIRKVTPAGIISTVAGIAGSTGYSGDGGPATAATLNGPWDVSVDDAGNLYIADYGNNVIRMVSPSGIISTVAGDNSIMYMDSGDGGPATAAGVYQPNSVTVDASGNLYIGTFGSLVRKVSNLKSLPSSPLSLLVPNGIDTGTYQGSIALHNGHCSSVYPVSVTVIGVIAGNAHLCTGNSATFTNPTLGGTWSSGNTDVATVSSTGVVTAVTVGTAIISYEVSISGTSHFTTKEVTVTATPSFTPGVMPVVSTTDTAGLLTYTGVSGISGYSLVWDSAATAAGFAGTPHIITTVAGNNAIGGTYSGDGGPATAAGMWNPLNVAADASGNLYITDASNSVIRKVSPTGIISTVAGNGIAGYSGDGGPATGAGMGYPMGIAVDAFGNLYIADHTNNVVRKVSSSGIISTVAGNGTWGYGGDGVPATASAMSDPRGLTVDASGNLYITEFSNHVVRKVTPMGIISTVAGNIGLGSTHSGDGGPATMAGLNNPNDVAMDVSGNLYIADHSNHVVRKVSPSGTISTVAGNPAFAFTYTGDGGPATTAGTRYPIGVAVDASGNLYIADNGNNVIRKVSASGIISTVAGNYDLGHTYVGDGGLATAAGLNNTNDVAVDASGNLYIADNGNHVIRKVSFTSDLPSSPLPLPVPGGVDTGTYYGSITLHNGHCSNTYPVSVTVIGAIAGNAHLCTGNSQTFTNTTPGGAWSSGNTDVATVSSAGMVTGIAVGTAIISYGVSISGTVHYATKEVTVTATPSFTPGTMPVACATDTAGLLSYAGLTGSADYSLTWDSAATAAGFAGTQHIITTVAGDYGLGGTYSGDGGAATTAGLNNANGGAVIDAFGNLYIADRNSQVIRKVTPSGIISTVAGTGVMGYNGDSGPATSMQLAHPAGLAVDALGTLYIADQQNNRIRKVSPTGMLTTVAGNGSFDYSGDGGPASAAALNYPQSVAVDVSGNVYISDLGNSVIRKISPSGIISTIAGNVVIGSTYSGDGGPATAAGLAFPNGIAVDATDNLYIADLGSNTIRKVLPSGIISTVVGFSGFGGYSGDGGLATAAELYQPSAIAVDVSGNLYVADRGNNAIRKVTPAGIISTIAGGSGLGYAGDGGPATAAQLYAPSAVTIDVSGNLYIADNGNNLVRKVSNIEALPSSPLPLPVPGGVDAGTYNGSITLHNGHCSNVYPVSLTVTAPPIISTSGGSTICSGGSATLTATGGSNYSWAPSSGLSSTTGASITATPAATTTYTVTGGTGSCTNTATVTVSVNPIPTIDASGGSAICAGSSATLTATGGSNYSWAPSSGLSSTTGESVTATPAATTTYTVTGGTGSCTNTATVTVSVNPLPTIGASGGSTICTGGSTTLTATGGSNYSWAPASGLSSTTGASITATPAATTNYTVTGGTASCTNTATVTVSVNPVPVIDVSGDNLLCQGNSSLLTASGGATYSWAPSSGLSATTGTSVTATPTTTTTYTIMGAVGVCSNTTTVTVFVSPAPSIGAGGGGTVCVGGSGTLTATGGISYSWAPSAGLSVTTGPSVVATPAATTTYTITGSDGNCTNTATVTVSVNSLPAIGAGGGSAICSGGSATLTATGGSNYTWSPLSGLSFTTGTSVTATPAVTTTYTVTGGTGSCTNTATVTVSVNALPTIGAGGGSIICSGGSATLTATGGSTYSWAPSLGLSATSGASVVATPTATTTYTVTGGTGSCTNTATVAISVNPLPVVSGAMQMCKLATTTLSGTPTGGTWSSSNGNASVSSSGVVTGNLAGTAIITYTLPTACYKTAIVTVNALPTVNISGGGSIAEGSSVTLTASGAATYIWSPAGTLSASTGASVTASPIVTTTYTVTGTASVCSNTATATVSVTPACIPPTIVATGGGAMCQGASRVLTVTGGNTYSWSPSMGLSSTTGASVTASPSVSTTYTVVGANSAGCTDTTEVTVNVSNSFPIGAGANVTICSGQSTVLSATGTALFYTWSPASSLSASTGAVVTATPTATTTYTLTGTSGFCVQTRTVSVTVSPSPTPITGTFAWCKGMTNSTLSSTPTGGTWSSSAPSIASINSATGAVYGANAGTALILYTKSGCSSSKEVTVVATPAIEGVSSICTGLTTTMTNDIAGGVWSSSADTIATIDAGTGLLTAIEEGVTTISYIPVGGCVATKQFTVGLPPPFTSNPWVCLGQSTQLTHPIPGGAWSSSNPARASVDAVTGVVHGITLGNFYISYTLATGCVRTQELAVETYSLDITGSMDVCEGLITNLSNEMASGTWSSSDAAVAYVSLHTGSVYGLTEGTANITYKFHACINSEVITVHPLPTTIMGDDELCGGNSATYSSTPTGGTWSSSNTSKVTTGLYTGIATGGASSGSVTLTYTSPAGCVATRGITVNPQPGVLSGVTTVCAGNSTTITSALEGGTWSSSDGGVALVGTALGWSTTVYGLLPGTTAVTATTEFGCTRSTIVTVTAAVGNIDGDDVVCPGGTIQLTNSATGGTWSSNATVKATVNTTTGLVNGVSAGTANISYKTSPTCYALKQITVNGTPVAVTGPAIVCVGRTVTLAHAEAGGTWTSSNTARATIDVTSGEVTGISAGPLTITYQINSGCSRTFAMTVHATPAAISGASILCQGSSTTLTNSTSGGTWSSSNTSVAMVPSTPGNVTGVGAGATTISYIITSTGCYATKDITVNEQPATISGGPNKLCIGAIETYTSTPAGGTWTSSMPTRANVDGASGQMTGISAGTLMLTYSLSTGCYRTLAMTVNALPAAIGGTAAVCQNATTALTNSTTGGTWSSSVIGTASVTATGVVTGVAAGMAHITYKVTATGCQATRQVTVNGLPSAISGANQLCIGNTEAYSSSPTGGTWLSSAGATINSTSGLATGVSAGVTAITYTAPVTDCRVMKQVTVSTVPAAITGPTTVCAGNSVTLSSTTLSQTWSSMTGAATITPISSGAATLTGVSAGTTIISYTNAAGCASKVTVNVSPAVPAVTGDMIVCPTRTIALSTTATGGTWSSALPTKATVNASGVVTGVNAGTVNISYILSPGCNALANVTVNAAPSIITGPTSVCAGSEIDLNHAIAGGTWSTISTMASVNATNGFVTGVSAGTPSITYSINSGCWVTTTINVKVSPATISGSLTVAMGSTSALASTTSGGTWTSNNTGVATIGSASGIMTGIALGDATITYKLMATQCYVTAEASVSEPPAGRQAGVSNTGNGSGILIYPNPTMGVLTIEASSEGVLTLYTLDGKEVQKYRTEAPSTSVSFPGNLVAGVYMCRYEGIDGSLQIVRIIYAP